MIRKKAVRRKYSYKHRQEIQISLTIQIQLRNTDTNALSNKGFIGRAPPIRKGAVRRSVRSRLKRRCNMGYKPLHTRYRHKYRYKYRYKYKYKN